MNRLQKWVVGSTIIGCPDCVFLTNFLLARNIRASSLGTKNGLTQVEISRSDLIRVLPDLDSTSIVICRQLGLPNLLNKYRKRPGIPAGIILFFLLLFLSTRFIWAIDVKGNSTIPDEEIITLLDELGCGVGTAISSLDYYQLCIAYLAHSDNISWISVNQIGTTAYVEVREKKFPAPAENNGSVPANLVADADGIVQRFEVFSGTEAVEVGTYVKKGQLLVSGIRVGKYGNIELVRAQGHVYAQTSAFLEVHIPLAITEKVYNEEKFQQHTIKIFGKSINLFRKGSNLPPKCDTIESSTPLTIFDQIVLPITVRTTTVFPYTERSALLTEEAARTLAHKEFERIFSEKVGKAEILSINTEEGLADGEYRILCEVYYLADIARTAEIGTEQNPIQTEAQ